MSEQVEAQQPVIAQASPGPELVFGVVTPIGTSTSTVTEALRVALEKFHYRVVVIRITDLLPAQEAPRGESEDQRVTRLMDAGDAFCKRTTSAEQPDGDPAALARLAVKEILQARADVLQQLGDQRPSNELLESTHPAPRTAYILHSLKRGAEVSMLREVYLDQFLLIGAQADLEQRVANLKAGSLSAIDPAEREQVAEQLIERDAGNGDPLGQQVQDTYPQADFFLREKSGDSGVTDDLRRQAERFIRVLFGQPVAPDIGEFAMYLARAARARSLAASRKVGSAIVVGDSVISTGYNDAPDGEQPDVARGQDTSERLKQENVRDTLARLLAGGLLSKKTTAVTAAEVTAALATLKGGELMSVIEYQRAVHAEAKAIDDATIRGVSPAGGTLYVTTYPCHLCFKHALSAHLAEVHYIDPYPKSRARELYPDSANRLVPFHGVAPGRFMELFDARQPFMSDPDGTFRLASDETASPIVANVRDDDDRWTHEVAASSGLREDDE